jgi:hypothetical protein
VYNATMVTIIKVKKTCVKPQFSTNFITHIPSVSNHPTIQSSRICTIGSLTSERISFQCKECREILIKQYLKPFASYAICREINFH